MLHGKSGLSQAAVHTGPVSRAPRSTAGKPYIGHCLPKKTAENLLRILRTFIRSAQRLGQKDGDRFSAKIRGGEGCSL